MLCSFYDRLIASGLFGTIHVAENLDRIVEHANAADDNDLVLVPWRERATAPEDAAGVFRQKVEVQIATAVVIRRHGDPRGGMRAQEFDRARHCVEAILAGWIPMPYADPVALIGGEGQYLGNNVSIFMQTWQTGRYLEAAHLDPHEPATTLSTFVNSGLPDAPATINAGVQK